MSITINEIILQLHLTDQLATQAKTDLDLQELLKELCHNKAGIPIDFLAENENLLFSSHPKKGGDIC